MWTFWRWWCRSPGFNSSSRQLKFTPELYSHPCVLQGPDKPLQSNVRMGGQSVGSTTDCHGRDLGSILAPGVSQVSVSLFHARISRDNDEVVEFFPLIILHLTLFHAKLS